MISVVVVDDSAFMRKALAAMLGKDPEIEVVATARDGEEGLEMIRRHQPDVVVHLPEGRDIVIDSKVTLTAYSRYVEAEEDAARQLALQYSWRRAAEQFLVNVRVANGEARPADWPPITQENRA